MIRIECVPYQTEAKMMSTGATISTASVPSNHSEQDAETIVVTRGVVCYSCDDGSFTVVTPAGATKMTDLWPATVTAPVVETPAPAPVVEEVPPPSPEPEAGTV